MRQTRVPSQTVTLQIPDGPSFRRGVVAFVGICILAYLAWVVREIWVPLGLAFVLAIVLDPVVDRMEAKGWKRPLASAVLFLGAIVAMGLALYLLVPQVIVQGQDVQKQFVRYFPDTSPTGLAESFKRLKIPEGVAGFGVKAFQSAQAGLGQSTRYIMQYGIGFVPNLVWLVITPLVAFYALVDFHLILTKAMLLVPRKNRNAAQTYVSEVSAVFAKYLRGLAILSLMNGAATTALLYALHVPSALIVGIAAGILYSVPYIGAIITVLVTAAASFVGGGVNAMLLAVGLSLVLHQLVFDQIISPRLLGGTVGLHPILSVIALLAGNLLLGIVGMILAVPFAACVQIIVVALVPKFQQEIQLADGSAAPTEAGALATQSREILAQSGKTGDGELDATVQKANDTTQAAAGNTPLSPYMED